MGLRPRKTSENTDVGGREEMEAARVTSTVLRTAIPHGTELLPGTETLRGWPRTVTEHASGVFADTNPVRLASKELLSFAH